MRKTDNDPAAINQNNNSTTSGREAVHQTHNDISLNTRKQVIELLQKRVAENIDLVYQVKQAHWTVKGPHFISLHELFDKVYDALNDKTDIMAERISQLGGQVQGTIQAAAKISTLKSYSLEISQGEEHVKAISEVLSTYAKSIRASIDQADELKDKDTADIFTEVSREVDKALWFVESHLEGER